MVAYNFLFHRVNPIRDQLWDPMDPALFEKIIKHIKLNYDVVKLEEIKGYTGKEKLATISFDDGYKDNIQIAIPILDKYQLKASFYVVTDCIEYNKPTWTYDLEYRFLHTKISEINLNFDCLPKELKVLKLDSKQDRLSYVKQLKPILKKLTYEDRKVILGRIESSYKDVELPKIMMNWDDLKVIRDGNHNIGSHTVSHEMMGTMNEREEIKNQLNLSRQTIIDRLGIIPLSISYPVGSYNAITIELSKEAGYEFGIAVKQRPYYQEKDNLFEIPRIELYNESWIKTKLRMNNSLEIVKKILKK